MSARTVGCLAVAMLAGVTACTGPAMTADQGRHGPQAPGRDAARPTTSGHAVPSPSEPAAGGRASPATDSDADAKPTGWGPTVGEWRQARLAASGMSDSELAGQVIVARYIGTQSPAALVAQYHLGGVIVMGDNIASVDEIRSSNLMLQSSAVPGRSWPLVVAVDQEGGIVSRLGAPMTVFPTPMSQGAAGSRRLARDVAAASGRELRAVGFNVVFAPDADVTIGPSDPTIGSRSAGSDPRRAARIVTAATAGYRSSGIVPVLKHFPGHGSVTADSHETLPVQHASLEQLGKRDFVPFARAIASGAPAIMVGHLDLEHVDPGVPADLSKPDIDLLSSEFGFRGLVVSDALEMAAVTQRYGAGDAAVTALHAGVDMVLMPLSTEEAYHGILGALQSGTLARARVEDAAAKIIALMLHEAAQPLVPASAIGGHRALSRRLSAAAVTLVQGPCTGPYVGPAVTPIGDPDAVKQFARAAQRAGLRIGGGERVALLGYGAQPESADVVVSLDTPYVLSYSTASVAKIALFGSGPAAMQALVPVLTGKASATGRLPVAVSGIDPPDC